MNLNRSAPLLILPLLLGCPAKSRSPLFMLGETAANASMPTDWVQDAYLKASNAGTGDWFGASVAVSGDTIIVGAQNEANNSTNINNTDNAVIPDAGTADLSGAVYVFKKDSAGNWIQDGYIKASNTGPGDGFGRAISISDDIIVVGAPWEDNNSTVISNSNDGVITDTGISSDSGSVYVFQKDASGHWYQDAYLKASNAGTGDVFGFSVGISGETIVVGAHQEDNNSTAINNVNDAAIVDTGTSSSSGAAYVFKRDDSGNWSPDAYLKASNSGPDDYFGSSVAIFGDTIVVGAYGEKNSFTAINNTDNAEIIDAGSATASGAVYVFKKDDSGNWIQDAYLKASNAGAHDCFGTHVAIWENTIVVGAYGEKNSFTGVNNTDNAVITDISTEEEPVGAAYVFKRDGSGAWIQDAYLKASNSGAGDGLAAVSISGDIIVVGAPQEDNSSTIINNTDNPSIVDEGTSINSGAVYVFKRDGSGTWVQDAYLKASNAKAEDLFGQAVAVSGRTIVVGAYREDNASSTINNTDNATVAEEGTATEAGAAYVFTLK